MEMSPMGHDKRYAAPSGVQGLCVQSLGQA